MSNQKKRAVNRAAEKAYEKAVTKRELEIVSVLREYVLVNKKPFDRKEQQAFFSGAVWSDNNPAPRTKRIWAGIGFAAGVLFMLIAAAVYVILKMENVL